MPSSSDATPPGRYHVTRYGRSRNFALYERHDGQHDLVAVTVYKKGASAVQRLLEARDAMIAAQAAQIAQLTAAVAAMPEPRALPSARFRERVRAEHAGQLAFFSEEERARYRMPPPGASPGRG